MLILFKLPERKIRFIRSHTTQLFHGKCLDISEACGIFRETETRRWKYLKSSTCHDHALKKTTTIFWRSKSSCPSGQSNLIIGPFFLIMGVLPEISYKKMQINSAIQHFLKKYNCGISPTDSYRHPSWVCRKAQTELLRWKMDERIQQ